MALAFEHIAVVGATGAVGAEVLRILEERAIPASRIVPLASSRSAGKKIDYAGDKLTVGEISAPAFLGIDIALFCATSDVSRRFIPEAVRAGSVVIDNSSAFRMDPAVPLVIPEINGAALSTEWRSNRLFANPNCSTIILLVALEPLRKAFGIDRIVVSTYQAVSGAGAAAMAELTDQARAALDNRAGTRKVFNEPCAFNVFSHNSSINQDTGLNGEEQKIIDESRKIWADPLLAVSPTCVRVPVLRAHTESITVTLARPATEDQVRAALSAGAGLEIIDDRAANSFPTPLKATGRDEVLVGRIRKDPGATIDKDGRTRGFSLLVCADQLRKGAALNAVQIAETLAPAVSRPGPVGQGVS